MQRISFALFALLLIAFPARAEQTEPDAGYGALLYSTRCSVCHATDVNKNGPLMHGIVGRKIGSVPGYDYSSGLKNATQVWDDASLDKYLTDPASFGSDTKMYAKVPNAKDRANIIAYLKRLSVHLAYPQQNSNHNQ